MAIPSSDPRPYSRFNPRTGQVEWVEPSAPAPGRNVRTRMENDDEVRRRLIAAGLPWSKDQSGLRGRYLDKLLRLAGLPERHLVEEVEPDRSAR